jgi:hypothetical protein
VRSFAFETRRRPRLPEMRSSRRPELQKGLQRFAKPWYRTRALRIFRDDDSLSGNPDLWQVDRAGARGFHASDLAGLAGGGEV